VTYEYRCSHCDHAWEADQPISAAPIKKCPKCNRNSAKRQISGGAGFILKGGGWYADGYASRGAGKGSDDAKPASSSAKGEVKGEAKGEARTDAKPEKSEKKSDTTPAPASSA
jgi:putative FmdB family regulatory protein